MKIYHLEYEDHEYQWKLEPVEFLPNLNLLVGISGVGKTEILKAISRLKKIANGASLNGVEWKIKFSTNDNINYYWQGKFELHQTAPIIDHQLNEEEISNSKHEKFKILSEELYRNDSIIIKRDEQGIIFNDEKTPKLSPFQSVIHILNQEDDIIPVKEELEKIIFTDFENPSKIWKVSISFIKQYENSSFKNLRNSDLPMIIKLSILYKYFPQEFKKIKESFQNIFTKVIDIKVESFKPDKLEQLPVALSDILRDAITISFKEKKINNWIENISSGMLKTFMYISELYLSPEGAVILIDEFENSLGVNCIDSVTDLILESKNIQFFITSHHPYIINNISPAYWKIVTRTGGSVSVKNAEDFHISNSRQKAFIDLINILEDNDEDMEEE